MIENSPTNNSLPCKVCRSEARDLHILVMHTTGLLHQAERRVRRRSLSALALRANNDQAVAILDTIGRDRDDCVVHKDQSAFAKSLGNVYHSCGGFTLRRVVPAKPPWGCG
jgi:hypothetical protein